MTRTRCAASAIATAPAWAAAEDRAQAANDRSLAAEELAAEGVDDSITHDLRSYDVICRFGGDEFLCSLAGQDVAGARGRFVQIGRRLSNATSGATITVGFAERAVDDTVEILIGRADAALVEARATP